MMRVKVERLCGGRCHLCFSIKYWTFRIGPVWSVSMAAAVMGLVLLGRRLYNMKKKAQRFHLKVTIDEKVHYIIIEPCVIIILTLNLVLSFLVLVSLFSNGVYHRFWYFHEYMAGNEGPVILTPWWWLLWTMSNDVLAVVKELYGDSPPAIDLRVY